MKNFIYFIIVFLVLSFPVYAIDDNGLYQYHNYEWGMDKDEVKKLIKENGYEYDKVYENGSIAAYEYKDRLLNDDVKIYMGLNVPSNELQSIVIQFDSPDHVIKKLLNILYEKYDKPMIEKNEKKIKYLTWINENKDVCVRMEYFSDPGFQRLSLYYMSLNYNVLQKYYNHLMKEKRKF